jgi:DNA polymerase (family 10)
MTNKEIARCFRQLASVMELLEENAFKIRSYQNAYLLIRKWGEPLAGKTADQLEAIPGIGKAIAAKVVELVTTGTMATLDTYLAKVPAGILEILDIPGIGPKKVRALWKELGIESVGELAYACHENRLILLSGFGEKTQRDVLEKLEFYLVSRDRWLGVRAAEALQAAAATLEGKYPGTEAIPTGQVRRACPVVDTLELLWVRPDEGALPLDTGWEAVSADCLQWHRPDQPAITVHLASPATRGARLWATTGSEAYLRQLAPVSPAVGVFPDEEAWLTAARLPVHPPEWREDPVLARSFAAQPGTPLQASHIRGVIHAHSTWSDGTASLRQMAEACQQRGYEYLVITDHSRSAFYANGLSTERVLAQHEEIDKLNASLSPFRILKGIESDILNNGDLDYEDAVLERFEIVIASIHSNLRMPIEKAMERLLRAIQHPRTHILGHLTGRLLLSRAGYPVDHERIIQACARHGVAIELNANPNRLDIDYTWIPAATAAGVKIAVNPDAHSIDGIDDLNIGVRTASKGGLTRENCLSAMAAAELLQHFSV